jgi:hypothetical protein
MFTVQEHVDNLVRHIELVREGTLLLGKRLINEGRKDFGRILIAKGFVHDASKFHGIEWQYLHAGNDVPKDKLELAIHQHTLTNPHHPEYWGGMENMPEIYVAEMVCDWYARGIEFGTGLRPWIKEVGIDRFKIDLDGEQYKWINKYVDILLQNSFVKGVNDGQG